MQKNLMQTAQCYLCGSNEISRRRDTIRYGTERDVLECNDCGLVFLRPEVEADVHRFYTDEKFRGLPRETMNLASHKDPEEIFSGRLAQANRRLSYMKDHLRPGMSMLEIGCSAGSFISVAKPYFESCKAVELDKTFAAYTRERQKIDVLEVPLEGLSESTEKFDAICMWHVLEHLPDPVAAVRILRGLLKDGGYLFIEVPNILDPLLTLWRVKEFEKFYYQEPHLYYFSPNTLARVFSDAGWSAKLLPVQIYGLFNHLRWFTYARPQSNQPGDPSPLARALEGIYAKWLKSRQTTDTLFAIAHNTDTENSSL